MIPDFPAIIVLNVPNAPQSGTHKYRCMICVKFWQISDTSYATVHEMRRDHKMYVVACFSCFQDLDPLLPAAMKAGRQQATISEARQQLGYR